MNREGLLLLTRNVNVCHDSSAGPRRILVAQFAIVWAPAFRLTNWSGPFVKDGASLTGQTEIVKVSGWLVSTPPFAVPPLSWSCTMTFVKPTAFGATVNVSVPS